MILSDGKMVKSASFIVEKR